jgi:hypothetical protein
MSNNRDSRPPRRWWSHLNFWVAHRLLPEPYELVDVSELVGEKRINGWEFAGKNGAYGVYEVFAVGFSSDMSIAIVYVGQLLRIRSSSSAPPIRT